MSILADIARYKIVEVAAAKAALPEARLTERIDAQRPPRGFRRALETVRGAGGVGLIAEIKRASPSKGLIRADFDPAEIAGAYRRGGAACLSVLTDGPSFQGSLAHLEAARAAVPLPILRKDFLIDPYQVAEARVAGADCILIILAMIEDDVARALIEAARSFGLDWLVEIHDREELERALRLDAPMIGINNRNLKTFETRLETSRALAPLVPQERLVIAESGITGAQDIARLGEAGITTFLVGESLMRADDVAEATQRLLKG